MPGIVVTADFVAFASTISMESVHCGIGDCGIEHAVEIDPGCDGALPLIFITMLLDTPFTGAGTDATVHFTHSSGGAPSGIDQVHVPLSIVAAWTVTEVGNDCIT